MVQKITRKYRTEEEQGITLIPAQGRPFSESYRDDLFLFWIQCGQPDYRQLHLRDGFPLDEWQRKPAVSTLENWAREDRWADRSKIIQQEVYRQITTQVVKEKVEMSRRHAEIGRQMQAKALAYFEEHTLTSDHAAARLLEKGIEVERQSVGIADIIEEATRLSDDKIISQITALMAKGQVTLEVIDDDEFIETPENDPENIFDFE